MNQSELIDNWTKADGTIDALLAFKTGDDDLLGECMRNLQEAREPVFARIRGDTLTIYWNAQISERDALTTTYKPESDDGYTTPGSLLDYIGTLEELFDAIDDGDVETIRNLATRMHRGFADARILSGERGIVLALRVEVSE